MTQFAGPQLAQVLLVATAAQAALIGLLGWMVLSVRREVRAMRRSDPRLRSMVEAFRPLVTSLTDEMELQAGILRETAGHLARTASELKDDPVQALPHRTSDTWRARDEARCLLAAGCRLESVAEQTGVTVGELQVMAAMLGPSGENEA